MHPATIAVIVVLVVVIVAVAQHKRSARLQEEAAEEALFVAEREAQAKAERKAKRREAKRAKARADANANANTNAEANANAGAVIPSTWGWAKVHLASAPLKAFGYYYRDRMAGYSFKILVDLLEVEGDDAIRDAARAKDYIANHTFRLGAHETIYPGAREGTMKEETEASFEAGIGPSGPDCAIVMMLNADEKRRYELPEHMPGIEIYAA